MPIDVSLSHEGRVETWWLNNPPVRNALDLAMWSSLVEHCDRVGAGEEVRVVVVRGRGADFSAGADISSLGRTLAADHGGSVYRATNQAAQSALAALPLPVVAAIDGYCLGGGVQLALACDLRVATTRARFAITPSKLGIVYPAGAIERLVAVVGVAVATELLLTAEQLDAGRAFEVGLLHRVVDDLDVGVSSLVTTLLSRSAFTQAASKAVLAVVTTATEATRLGEAYEQMSLQHDDLHEGLAAFADRRTPEFEKRVAVRDGAEFDLPKGPR